MKNWIMNFINDERGAETFEVAIAAVVIGGGSVAGYTDLKTKIGEKQDVVIGKLDESTAE